MPDLRFLSEATFIIGCGVGFLSGTLVSWTLHAWTLAGMETDRPFEGGRLKAFEKEARPWDTKGNALQSIATASEPSSKSLARTKSAEYGCLQLSGSTSGASTTQTVHPGTAVRLNRRQKINLCALILNETTRNANDLPREDVPLTHETLARYGFGSKVRRRVRDEIVEKKLGWKDDAGTVYLSRHKAREFVARARRAGVIGG